jgi:SAM-dependent methyltransferase
VLRTRSGSTIPLRLDRWHAGAEEAELTVLAGVAGPVIDIGCGPGRHTMALAERGLVVLGVDASRNAVSAARERGATVLHRSVFDPLPGEGRWATALLLDGNIGIGGDPVLLLGRVLDLLAPQGLALVEVEPPGVGLERLSARVERGEEHGPWFPWARLGLDALDEVATRAGFTAEAVDRSGDRWFARVRVT